MLSSSQTQPWEQRAEIQTIQQMDLEHGEGVGADGLHVEWEEFDLGVLLGDLGVEISGALKTGFIAGIEIYMDVELLDWRRKQRLLRPP